MTARPRRPSAHAVAPPDITSRPATPPQSTEPAEPNLAPCDGLVRAPLATQALLARHHCRVLGDTRYRSALRLRQALWRRDHGLAPGPHRPAGRPDRAPVALGSLLTPADAMRGLNFATPAVHSFVRRDLALREEGACVHPDRVFRNLLSSEALAYNIFAPLSMDCDLASTVFRQLLPEHVTRVRGITFETAPARRTTRHPGEPDRADRYLSDRSAFDLALHVDGPAGPGAVFVEMKLTEGCQGPAATHRPRYDEATREASLHRDPDDPALRSVQLEQFRRLHVLAQLCVRHGVTPRAHLVVLYPRLNREVRRATTRYAETLLRPEGAEGQIGFGTLVLEDVVAALAAAGAAAQAAYLADRYLDLRPVLDLILDPNEIPPEDPAPDASSIRQPDAGSDTVSLLPAPALLATAPGRRRVRPPAETRGAPRRSGSDDRPVQ